MKAFIKINPKSTYYLSKTKLKIIHLQISLKGQKSVPEWIELSGSIKNSLKSLELVIPSYFNLEDPCFQRKMTILLNDLSQYCPVNLTGIWWEGSFLPLLHKLDRKIKVNLSKLETMVLYNWEVYHKYEEKYFILKTRKLSLLISDELKVNSKYIKFNSKDKTSISNVDQYWIVEVPESKIDINIKTILDSSGFTAEVALNKNLTASLHNIGLKDLKMLKSFNISKLISCSFKCNYTEFFNKELLDFSSLLTKANTNENPDSILLNNDNVWSLPIKVSAENKNEMEEIEVIKTDLKLTTKPILLFDRNIGEKSIEITIQGYTSLLKIWRVFQEPYDRIIINLTIDDM